MSTPDTNNIGIKLQAAGENLNTWGDPNLNNDLIVLSNMGSKWNALTINGDTTISETNYATTNDTEVATIDLVAGTVAAAFNLVFPSRDKRLLVRNSSGFAATCKLSATAGFALPTGRIAWIATDGSTDMVLMSANFGGLTSPTSGSRDIPAWSAVETAIANAALPATAGTVRVSALDTTSDYLAAKVNVTGSGAASVVASTTNPGANEVRTFAVAVGALALTAAAEQTAGFTAVAGNIYPVNIAASGTILFPAAASNGDTVGITNYGAGVVTFNWNGLKYNGSTTSLATNSKGIAIFRYGNATNGWTDA